MAVQHLCDSGETLDAALRSLARTSPSVGVRFPETSKRIDAAALDDAATRCAAGLLAEGVEPGDLVGLLMTTTPMFLINLFGVLRAGAAVTVLPAPSKLSDEPAAARRMRNIVAEAGVHHVICDPALAELARKAETPRVLEPPPASSGRERLPSVAPGDLAIVQFTSGSTGRPRGVRLHHRTAMAGLRAIVESSALTPADTLAQWVPLFHDMGLFGLLANLLNGSDCHLFSPMGYIRRPGEFLRYFSEHRCSLSTGTSFGYELLLGAVGPEELAALDLSAWRLAFNGAEPVSASVVREFQERLAPAGVRRSVMYPVYGMAEATLAISFPRPGDPPATVHIDRDELSRTRRARPVPADEPNAKALVSVGRPVAGMELRVLDDHGRPCPDGGLGEIQISGPSVMDGYYNDPAATRASFDGEWFRTGDLGFTRGSDLFIAGRRKEMAIVNGRNFFPEDAEEIARETPGLYRKRCVSFADTAPDGREQLCVVVETKEPECARPALADQVRARVVRGLGVPAVRVHVVGARWLTRTTSGKWQRTLAKHRLATE
ncbi:AMP-binding protein [Actinomadura rubrisoli]|nr:AMP-binding protein [Actinomadura rubrisoli]